MSMFWRNNAMSKLLWLGFVLGLFLILELQIQRLQFHVEKLRAGICSDAISLNPLKLVKRTCWFCATERFEYLRQPSSYLIFLINFYIPCAAFGLIFTWFHLLSMLIVSGFGVWKVLGLWHMLKKENDFAIIFYGTHAEFTFMQRMCE